VSDQLQFLEVDAAGSGTDELLAESRWTRLIDRLLTGHRVRHLLVVAAATVSVATFGGTRVTAGTTTVAAPPESTSTRPAAPAPAIAPAIAPASINVCTDEWVYVEDPDQPGVRPYESLYCPVRPAGHPVRTG
jgi:hypothetical protein